MKIALFLSALVVLVPVTSMAQSPGASIAPNTSPPPPPATKLEAFKPSAGSVVTLGYDDLGSVRAVEVDVRELRESSARGTTARGLLVEVSEGQYRKERSFVDADEIPELLRGIDALLEVKTNPTSFKNFEVRYTTKGELRLTAFNSGNQIKYAVEAGRGVKAQCFVDVDDMQRLRQMFAAAQTRLTAGSQ